MFLVYRLARHVLRGGGWERTLSAVAGLVAAAGPCAVSLLATTFGDNLLSILVLAAFLLLLQVAEAPENVGSLPSSVPVLVLGWLAFYGAWAIVFHYYRYFAAGEFLAPVAILALLRMLGTRRLPIVWPGIAALVVLTAASGSWGRIDWADGPLRVQAPFDPRQTPAVVLLDGFRISFVLPFFPPGVRFFGVTATGEAFERLVSRELERHEGPVFRLRLRALSPTPLPRLGLVDTGSCEDFRTGGRGRLSLCRLERAPPSPGY